MDALIHKISRRGSIQLKRFRGDQLLRERKVRLAAFSNISERGFIPFRAG